MKNTFKLSQDGKIYSDPKLKTNKKLSPAIKKCLNIQNIPFFFFLSYRKMYKNDNSNKKSTYEMDKNGLSSMKQFLTSKFVFP